MSGTNSVICFTNDCTFVLLHIYIPKPKSCKVPNTYMDRSQATRERLGTRTGMVLVISGPDDLSRFRSFLVSMIDPGPV